MLSGTIRSAKTDGSAVWLLMGISFAYGVFHAAGPGHGKAVISSYLVANEETWKRGIVLSFLSAFLQALVAVALVGIAAALLGATAGAMNRAVWWIEVASYLLIAAMGAQLLWVKGRAFLRELAALRAPKSVGAAATVAHDHHHGHHPSRSWPRASTTITRIITTCARSRRPFRPFARADAGSARRSRRLEARPRGDLRGRSAALLGRDPGAGVRAGAGHLLGRRRGDLRDGPRHRDHGRGHRDAHRHGDRLRRQGSRRPAPATARSRCVRSRSARPR